MRNVITVVSGLPRSGTSMMMQMLAAGGIPCLQDSVREADESNPAGYYELEQVKDLRTDSSWMAEAQGKAVKIIVQLLPYLPDKYEYRVVFMRRAISEVMASQDQMLTRMQTKAGAVPCERLAAVYARQMASIRDDMVAQQISMLDINYRDAVESPLETAHRVADFVGGNLDADAMACAVNPDLYRERSNAQEQLHTSGAPE